MRIQIWISFLTLLLTYHQCYGANILLLEEVLSHSHHLWFKKVTAALVVAGHNVTVVTPEADVSSENLHYIYMDKVYESVYKSFTLDSNVDIFSYGEGNAFTQISQYCGWLLNICSGFIESEGWELLKNYPKDFKFDLVIHDFPSGICLLSFLEKFNYPPLIFMTAYGDYNFIAYSTKSSLIPSLSPHLMLKEPESTFLGRIENYLLYVYDYLYYHYYIFPEFDKLVAPSFKNLPPLIELAQRSILSIFNYDAAIDGVRQLPPNVIGVGGLQIEAPKALTEELKSIADQATTGLILFSLGSNVRSEYLGDVRVVHILNAFANFPDYTFLWKFESDKLPMDLPKNVFISKWIPQNDVLAHKNTKLFITHAGLLSTQEAVWHAIPMLTMPVFIDQYGNSFKSVTKGFAEQLLIKDLSTFTLTEKIRTVVSDQKYKINIVAASKAFKDQKDTPLERGLWWIEWAIRNPDAVHFKSSGTDLSFIQIQSIDVIATLTLISVIVVFAIFVILRKLINRNKSSLLNSHGNNKFSTFPTIF